MKKRSLAAVVTGFVLAGVMAAGCSSEKAATADNPDVQSEAADAKGAEEENQLPIEIDTEIPIEKGARIAVVVKSTAGEFWKQVRKGMEDAIDTLNEAYELKGEDKITMTFEGPEDAAELTDMINTVDAVLSENPSALCLAAGDEDAGEAQLETARDNGIPVILFDSMIATDEELYTAYCGTDDKELGREAGSRLAEAMNYQGKAAVISHWSNDQTCVDRVAGFTESLTQEAPQIQLIAEIPMKEEGNLEENVEKLLEENPDLDGVFCTNIDSAEATLDALDAIGAEGLKVVGVDGSSRQIEAIQEGKEVGVVSQNPYGMGFQTIYLAAQAACPIGNELEKMQNTEFAWLDAENLEDEALKPYIYK